MLSIWNRLKFCPLGTGKIMKIVFESLEKSVTGFFFLQSFQNSLLLTITPHNIQAFQATGCFPSKPLSKHLNVTQLLIG